jgi:hypothetical protein
LLAAVAIVGGGIGGWVLMTRAQTPPGPVVLVSGRDDHGMLHDHEVALYAAPDSEAVVAWVHDGRLARVVEGQGQWLRVRALGSPAGEGWINDYYLRNRALRTDGGGQVALAEAREEPGRVLVAVRPATQPETPPVWLDQADLQEVGARSIAGGAHD